MDAEEIVQRIRDDDRDVCQECGNRLGNELVLPTEGAEGTATCAECHLSWVLEMPEE